ncbi:hypothetical protein EMIHUDRAFT_450175 [Emiliania huxleyi CCMP1516]|uniref:Fe2OG dioxygenase domain-containing protein n=2 Tax=Emiliania huxleyi TaxID=2903 RepID=A0A0D3JUH4_EMIH1|nr:hypothetical protein EMIHUDRAFT_458739 [Emiliania huxleyi CCMP1516]XP_005779588.1 hypothetical protein EMIHUDRAFT_450175 [Emiliania huxleyi CCMP1516]EOD19305.1 hypothetical protein EMIHUDRAFT_458739 [Emiliania huxleyi CCMP1516]EOD27159.1 hypothetical protein EMIHUDRAFT_450175 [Emiliania huxleyi CCMP1516]|eukprot:XP_005771734.1 hypothetical protein EMIHUDRAFT_458739 [Emiliania huxleyi CCMP1516]
MAGDIEMLHAAARGWAERSAEERVRGRHVCGASWACKLARAYLPAADAPSPREAPATLPSSRAALVARLSTAVPASAVDFHISNVLDGALAQPEAMWQCSSSVTNKHLWERGERETAHGPAATAGAQLRATPPRLQLLWAALSPACGRFAAEHVQRHALGPCQRSVGRGSESAVVNAAAGGRCEVRAHAVLRGLFLVHDFVTEEEEAALLQWMDGQQPGWRLRHFNGPALGMRWGATTDLRRRSVTLGAPMPPPLLALTARMRTLPVPSPLAGFEANEANALRYVRAEGHFLGPHCDDRQLSGDTLVNLSLAGEATMTYAHDRDGSRPPVRVRLPRRSLQIQTEDVRFNHTHGIAAEDLPELRVSVTFRRAKLTQ